MRADRRCRSCTHWPASPWPRSAPRWRRSWVAHTRLRAGGCCWPPCRGAPPDHNPEAASRLVSILPLAASRRGRLIQFGLATFSRVSRQRLVVSAGVGLGGLAASHAHCAGVDGRADRSAVEAPHPGGGRGAAAAHGFCVVTALRVAAAAPAEFQARWVFSVAPSPWTTGRDALRRIMLALGVLPIAAISAAFWWVHFGPARAIEHAIVTALAGLSSGGDSLVGRRSHTVCTRALDSCRRELAGALGRRMWWDSCSSAGSCRKPRSRSPACPSASSGPDREHEPLSLRARTPLARRDLVELAIRRTGTRC